MKLKRVTYDFGDVLIHFTETEIVAESANSMEFAIHWEWDEFHSASVYGERATEIAEQACEKWRSVATDKRSEKMRILRLNLKREHWEEIRDGAKVQEFRRITPYWIRRIVGRAFDEVHLCLGYPRSDDASKVLKRKWRGYSRKRIIHREFGPKRVDVFAIDVSCCVR